MMNPKDARVLSRRLGIHLMRNEFKACHDILDKADAKIKSTCPVNIAELDINLRWVNALEEMGYIKISDLDGISWEALRARIVNIGPAGIADVKGAVETAREQIKLVKKVDEAEKEAWEYMQAYE